MLITNPEALKQFYTDQRIWQGIPSVEVTAGGRIFVTFYSGGTKEEYGNYAMVVMSDDGENYSEPVVAAYREGYRCFDPCLWIDPMGRLWFTWAIAPEDAVWAAVCDDPDAEVLSWCEPFKIGHDVMMNKPVVLSTGEWLFPLAVWNYDVRTMPPEFDSKTPDKGSFVYKTVDNGKTFTKLGAADVPSRHFDEHMVVELRDRRLMMLVRTRYGIGVSYSSDRGRTWTKGADSGLGGPSSRFHITRLRSGRLLLINHVNFTKRNNLMALLSDDDGKTWSKGLMLDARTGVAYPDAKEADDGYIYITYDYSRGAFKKTLDEALSCAREILIARVTEREILQGALSDPGSYLQRVVSKLGAYNGPDRNPFGEVARFTDRELAEALLRSCSGPAIINRVFEHYPLPCDCADEGGLDVLIDAFEDSGYSDAELLLRFIALVRKLSYPGEPSPAVERMRSWIGEHAAEDFTLGQMAADLRISHYYMCHLFKQMCGITILEYRNSLRLTMAKQSLIRTSQTISQIAANCGFGTAAYFGEIFLAAEGLTPSQYRELHK